MYCTRNVTEDLIWVGSDDRRLAVFEGVYAVPRGMSYNSYLLCDEKTVLFDTVDQHVSQRFMENVAFALQGRTLDYVVIQHMEPDHSATLQQLLLRYPEATVVCNSKTQSMIRQFYGFEPSFQLVNEESVLQTGRHELHFVMAPMVHWPEVMVTYDAAGKILFSADAFGTFGALDGALFADEVDFMQDHLSEARRYYCNIVGKYGVQVQALLKKAAGLEVRMLCPLHGFVWRRDLKDIIEKYQLWSSYTPERKGVVIAYGSVYGNTENAANILACRLRESGVTVELYDSSVVPASEILAAAFRNSHLVFASATYNAGIFLRMDELLRDLVAHNIQNRTVALMENGSWAPTSGKQMRSLLEACKNMTFLEPCVSLRSALTAAQPEELERLAAEITASM